LVKEVEKSRVGEKWCLRKKFFYKLII
jgi:hypothetical protein